MISSHVKVRFAPSPTGPLHIGGVRTALFNYLFARQSNGEFILRIEDTDLERSRSEYEKEILDSLMWLGLEWDGQVIRQSERIGIYKKYSDQLIEKGLAYPFEGSIKFKVPKQKVFFHDLVHGDIEFDSISFDDFVIQKSNGFPTYNFACVIDDHEMGMTHLIRGDDHLSNTPRQILLYQAFQWKLPEFAHLPLVLGRDAEPLSKRHGEVNLTFYKNQGYLADGLLNYLALLGWSGGANQEFFPKAELIKRFSIAQVNKTSAMFDEEKLKWLNGEHVNALSDDEFVRQGKSFLQASGKIPEGFKDEAIKNIILLFRSRVRIWNDLLDQAEFFWIGEISYDQDAVREYFRQKETCSYLSDLIQSLDQLPSFSDENQVESALRACAEKLKVPARALIHPTRVAITGKKVSPSLFSVMKVMGKDLTMKRLKVACARFSQEKIHE